MRQIQIIDNYIKNVDEILLEVKKPHIDKMFRSRAIDSKDAPFKTIDDKNATMYTLGGKEMPHPLLDICLKTVNFKPLPQPKVFINRYLPGSWLGKHKDGIGGYWKFQLIFLQSSKSHFTWYDESGNSHLVEEKPGRCVEVPLDLVHESTIIEPDEDTKYSMVFLWGGNPY